MDYDTVSIETLGTVSVKCTHRGTASDSIEFDVHRVTYHNRSENSVFPATDEYYFDHDEIAALFPECHPRGRPSTRQAEPAHLVGEVADYDGNGRVDRNDWADWVLDEWAAVYANWDTKTHDVNGKQVASGWWTDEQLKMYIPSGNVTAQSARQEAFYTKGIDLLWLRTPVGPGSNDPVNSGLVLSPAVQDVDGRTHYTLRNLYHRLENAVGYVSERPDSLAPWDVKARWIRDDGLPGYEPNPSSVRAGELLWDWTDARYSFVPVDKEPTAWAMRTLLKERSYSCVASHMREHCENGDFHSSPHMRHPYQGGSRLGAVLWSAVCPEISP